MLPRLLADAQAATHAVTKAEAGRAAGLAAQVHQITAATLLRFGEADLGHVAARESLRLAAGAFDLLRMASARYILGHVLISPGRYIDAERVSVTTAKQIQPTA
jgi:hypothetical protein